MKKLLPLFFILILVLAACGQAATPTPTAQAPAEPTATPVPSPTDTPAPAEPVTLRLMTHDSFEISEDVMTQFETATGIKVEILKSGDGGAALNQAILAKDNPLADVFYGVDNTFLSRALENNIFVPYESPELKNIPDMLKLDAENRALPVDYGDVCLNYDKAFFAASPLDPPSSLEDLADPAYKNLTVVENPATSTPGLAFLLATVGHFGTDGYLDFWQKMKDNGVSVADGWEDAYWGQFSAASDGDRPIVVSYATSPAAEVFYAEQPLDESPTAAVVSAGTCFRQIEFVGILKGTKHLAEAQKLVDFMLSKTFQEDIPLNMWVYPANSTAALPDVFTKFSAVPEKPATVSPDIIQSSRETWLDAWTQVVLQ